MNVLKINGHDYTSLLAKGGVSWKRNNLDSQNTGRTTMDGTMHISRVAVKWTGQFTMLPLTDQQLMSLLNDLEPVFVTVEYYNPQHGVSTGTFYANNPAMNLIQVEKNGKMLWDGITFPLIER